MFSIYFLFLKKTHIEQEKQQSNEKDYKLWDWLSL